MRPMLEEVTATRGGWHRATKGTFREGIHLISGEVGSRKSTLAFLMAGLYPATLGSVIREQCSSAMISFQFLEYLITGTTVREEC
ncbi:MAG: hypothetical protein WCF90_01880 [Methanomicrobiales archaeon]